MFWPIHCHPDFGYLAPTSRFWKLARVGAIAGTAGLFAGSVGVIALSQRPEFEGFRQDIADNLRGSVQFVFAPPSDRVSAPADVGCASQTYPDRCVLATQSAPEVLQERSPARRRSAKSASSNPREQVSTVPASPVPVTATSAATSSASALPAAGTEQGIAEPPTAAVNSTPAETAPQKTRARFDARRTRELARLDPQSRGLRAERRGVIGEPGNDGGRNEGMRSEGMRSEGLRNEGGRRGNNPAAQPAPERRGFFWCVQGQSC